jgi:hypothetical protein
MSEPKDATNIRTAIEAKDGTRVGGSQLLPHLSKSSHLAQVPLANIGEATRRVSIVVDERYIFIEQRQASPALSGGHLEEERLDVMVTSTCKSICLLVVE